MPIQHTVVFALIHPEGSPEEADFLSAARRALAVIPGVEHFAVHRQISTKSNLTWQFSMIFAHQEAYDRYGRHPEHASFVSSRWVPEVAEFQEFDFVLTA